MADTAQVHSTINGRSRGAQHTSEHTKERSLIHLNKHTDNAQLEKMLKSISNKWEAVRLYYKGFQDAL